MSIGGGFGGYESWRIDETGSGEDGERTLQRGAQGLLVPTGGVLFNSARKHRIG